MAQLIGGGAKMAAADDNAVRVRATRAGGPRHDDWLFELKRSSHGYIYLLSIGWGLVWCTYVFGFLSFFPRQSPISHQARR
eukprot:scaffold60699_cov21-Prasinocladus_malaysianus.AAC.1